MSFGKIVTFIFSLSLITLTIVNANDNAGSGGVVTVESIDWQKIKLQDSVKKRYESVISKIITSSKFIVNVSIETEPISKSKKSDAKDELKNVKQVKFNDSLPSASKGDSIIFTKLGLEAPLLQDQDNYKRESYKKTINEISNNFDIFNFLKSINVEVLLNEKLEIKTRKVVEDLIIGTQTITSNKIKPRINIKYISMDEVFVPVKLVKPVEPTFIEKLSKTIPMYANALGLILSVLTLGVISIILFRKYSELQERQMELMKSQKIENKNENKEKENLSKSELLGKGISGSGADHISDEESIKAFERFKNFLTNSPIESNLLIKKWIKSEDNDTSLALNALVKQLTNDELKNVFESLSIMDRKTWKMKLKLDINDDEIKFGNTFISSQIVENIIAPPVIKDPEIIQTISTLTPKQGAEIIKLNIDSGAILMNIMPPKFASEMLEHLSQDMADSLINLSVMCTEDKILDSLSKFKENLPVTKALLNKSPFLENLLAHIAFAGPYTEKTLFKLLTSVESFEFVLQTAISNLPVEIINNAPGRIVKASLQLLQQKARVHYLYNQEVERQEHLLNLIAIAGSKNRDLINLEFEKIQNDPGLLEELTMNKVTIEKNYQSSVRKIVRNNPDMAKEIRPLVTKWIEELMHNSSNTDDDSKSVNVIKMPNFPTDDDSSSAA